MEIKPAPEPPRRIVLKTGARYQIHSLSKPGQLFPLQVMANSNPTRTIQHFGLVKVTRRMVLYHEIAIPLSDGVASGSDSRLPQAGLCPTDGAGSSHSAG